MILIKYWRKTRIYGIKLDLFSKTTSPQFAEKWQIPKNVLYTCIYANSGNVKNLHWKVYTTCMLLQQTLITCIYACTLYHNRGGKVGKVYFIAFLLWILLILFMLFSLVSKYSTCIIKLHIIIIVKVKKDGQQNWSHTMYKKVKAYIFIGNLTSNIILQIGYHKRFDMRIKTLALFCFYTWL